MEEEIKTKSPLFLSSFWIKIIAIVSMTIDHVAQVFYSMYPYTKTPLINNLYTIGKTFGRLALPLFCFMIVEGVLHTKNLKKYLLRLGIGAGVISLVLLILYYSNIKDIGLVTKAGNIFLDLLLLAVTIAILKQDDKRKYLYLIPIMGLCIASFAVRCYEYKTQILVWALPDYLRPQYDWFSLLLGVGYYYSYTLTDAYYEYQKQFTGLDSEFWKGTPQHRLTTNLFMFGVTITASLIYFLFGMLNINNGFIFYNPYISSFAAVSGIILIFYNGKRGYNKKWFQYGTYFYYPLHLLIILMIFALIWR